MNNGYEFLAEKEAIWADMLQQVLSDHDIPCVAIPVFGAGLTLKAGMRERFKLYVPMDRLDKARELLHELFPDDGISLDPITEEDPYSL